MLGLHEISNQFSDLKKDVNDQFDKGDQEIIDDIENQKDIQLKNIDESKPKIPAYDNLPEQQQKKVFS